MTKLKKKKKFQVYLISIILIILSLFLIYKFYILKPCSKFLGPEEVRHNISEYPFYELDLSPWVLEGFGNSEIIVNVKCMGEFQRYLFRKNFDFTEFKYVWASEDYDRGVKIKYGFQIIPMINQIMFFY